MALTSFFVTEKWLSAQGDEAKNVELPPSGFDVKSFPRQSRSRGGGIATVCKSTLLGTLLKLTAHHLLLSFPVFQSFDLLKRRTSTVSFCALY